MDVRGAAERLSPYARPTPFVRALLLSRDLQCEVFIKNETVSPIASFKWRGALNAILRQERAKGVVTSSTGNHGQGVAWAARTTGVPAHIFLPLAANPTKRAKIALLGATIHDVGHDLDAAKEIAIAFARDEGLLFIDDGESEGVIEGAATIGLEIANDLSPHPAFGHPLPSSRGEGQTGPSPRVGGEGARSADEGKGGVDIVFVPMGSGSLASGIALAIKERFPNARVIAVQSATSSAMVESFHARRAIERPAHTIADGLVCRVPAQLALDQLIRWVDDAIAVPDSELMAAARSMALGAHLLVEPAGAAGLAAAFRYREEIRGKRVVLIATGSNITGELFAQLHAAGDE